MTKMNIQAYVELKCDSNPDWTTIYYVNGNVTDTVQFERGVEQIQDRLKTDSVTLLNGDVSHIGEVTAELEDCYLDFQIVEVNKSYDTNVTNDNLEVSDVRIIRVFTLDEEGYMIQGQPLVGNEWKVK